MKKIIFTAFLVCPLFLFAQTAKIRIDIDRAIGEIDPKIYGVFMEPIQFSGRRLGLPDSVKFNTLYGTLYVRLHRLPMSTALRRTTWSRFAMPSVKMRSMIKLKMIRTLNQYENE